MRHSGESVGNSFELACPGGSAGFRFFVASSGGEMGRRRENRFAQRLQPKADPEQAPFGFEVADLLGAVPDLFKKRLAPIDIALVCPTRKWVTNSVIRGQDPVQECLSLVLQFLHAQHVGGDQIEKPLQCGRTRRPAFGQPQVVGYERKAGWKQVSSVTIMPWRLFDIEFCRLLTIYK